jgi:hypothetical protein
MTANATWNLFCGYAFVFAAMASLDYLAGARRNVAILCLYFEEHTAVSNTVRRVLIVPYSPAHWPLRKQNSGNAIGDNSRVYPMVDGRLRCCGSDGVCCYGRQLEE